MSFFKVGKTWGSVFFFFLLQGPDTKTENLSLLIWMAVEDLG